MRRRKIEPPPHRLDWSDGLRMAFCDRRKVGRQVEFHRIYDYLTIVLPRKEAVVARSEQLTTRVSTKGQVILPKAVRELRHWNAGTRLVVENVEEGVLLKAAPLFAPTTLDDVFCALPYKGQPKSLEEMDAAIAHEARRRARD